MFQKWDGATSKTISGWITPYEDIVQAKIEESAKAFREQTKDKPK